MDSSEDLDRCGGAVHGTPTVTLFSAHREIRGHIRVIWNLAELMKHERETIVRSATLASSCLQRGLRIHRQDEELSVFPRLEQAFPGLSRRIKQVHDQHEIEEASVSTVASLCERLSAEPSFLESVRSELRLAVRHLTVSLETHMSFEERQLFPALVHLPENMQNSILAEMRERRHDFDSIPTSGDTL